MNHMKLIPNIFIAVLMLLSAPAYTAQQGEYITLETEHQKSFKAYVAGPMDTSRGILLIHGWLGLNQDIEALTMKFAKSGYRTMAIDLYGGDVANNPKDAKLLMMSVKQSEANDKYRTALQALVAPGRKLATIGWSYGGSQALHATLSAPKLVSATVSYYPFGKMISDKKTLEPMQGPILILVGDEDFSFTRDKVKSYQDDMANAGKILQVKTYNAKHGFDREKGKNYNQAAQVKAEAATHQFLDVNLN
ncbi:dienelactone hydrolase family protein [Desulfosarcina sp.]|nr:dienelactone hydrolase family protein [Desulfosarcina sp.]